MADSPERSLIPQPLHDLPVPQSRPGRILGRMVESSLNIATDFVDKEGDLDALVQTARGLTVRGSGNEMHPNNVRAFRLFLHAAERCHAEAQYEVAQCFGFGGRVALNLAESDKWLKLAAEQGHPHAQSDLGMYRLGKTEEAAYWLQKAAEQGIVDAQMSLGFCYKAGEGVNQDYCKAYAWLRLAFDTEASDQSEIDGGWGGSQVQAIASLLSPARLMEAQTLYQHFKQKYPVRACPKSPIG